MNFRKAKGFSLFVASVNDSGERLLNKSLALAWLLMFRCLNKYFRMKGFKVYSTNILIFDYDNYRKYLQDVFEDLKKQETSGAPAFSHRKFAKTAGFSSPNFVWLLIKGDRNLSTESALKIAKAFRLTKIETQFFTTLVQYNQAINNQDKFQFASALVQLRSQRGLDSEPDQKFRYYSHWIHIAIRELLLIEPQLEMEQIAKRLSPPQDFKEVERAVKDLIALEMIEKGPEGWQVYFKNLEVGDGFTHQSVVAFHKSVIELASSAVDRCPSHRREISASTIPLSQKNLELVREKIQKLRLEILELADQDLEADEVFQINFQVFPLTDKSIENSPMVKSKDRSRKVVVPTMTLRSILKKQDYQNLDAKSNEEHGTSSSEASNVSPRGLGAQVFERLSLKKASEDALLLESEN